MVTYLPLDNPGLGPSILRNEWIAGIDFLLDLHSYASKGYTKIKSN